MGRFIIETAGIKAEVERKRVKCIRLYVKPPDGHIYISAPTQVSLEVIKRFVESKREWIKDKQKKYAGASDATAYDDGDGVMLWGEERELLVRSCAGRERAYIKEGTIVLETAPDSTAAHRGELLDALYREQLLAALPPVAKQWEERMGVAASEWHARRMKTRWGSCNTVKRRIWLNLRLAMLPPECMSYVVAHELCHLHEPSHNARFHSLMDGFYPEWKQVKRFMHSRAAILSR